MPSQGAAPADQPKPSVANQLFHRGCRVDEGAKWIPGYSTFGIVKGYDSTHVPAISRIRNAKPPLRTPHCFNQQRLVRRIAADHPIERHHRRRLKLRRTADEIAVPPIDRRYAVSAGGLVTRRGHVGLRRIDGHRAMDADVQQFECQRSDARPDVEKSAARWACRDLGAVPVSPPCVERPENDVATEPPQLHNAATDSPISTNRTPLLRQVRARRPRYVRPFEGQNDSNDSCGSRIDIPPADRHDGFCDFALRPCS